MIVKNSKDFAEEAKAYCLDNKPPCKPGDVPTSLFTDLLKIYFASPEQKVQSQAMEILKEQAGSLDVVATLQLLPQHTPMHLLTPWLTKALQDGVHQSRHMAVTTKLYQMENLRVKAKNAEISARGGASRPTKSKRAPKAAGGPAPAPARAAPRDDYEDDDGEGDYAPQQQARADDDYDDEDESEEAADPRESVREEGDLMAGW